MTANETVVLYTPEKKISQTLKQRGVEKEQCGEMTLP